MDDLSVDVAELWEDVLFTEGYQVLVFHHKGEKH